MMTAYQSENRKLEVRENFDDEDNSDDIDDEVFIRDGRNGFRLDGESGLKKPLMAPRRKPLRNGKMYTEINRTPPFRVMCAPICYGLIALGALLGFIVLVVFLVKYLTSPFSLITFWKKTPTKSLEPCNDIQVEDVWIKNFPKLVTESAFRLVDVNQDKVLDIILGYGTGADGYHVPKFVCDVYFGGQKPCFGGVLALDGNTGEELWRQWTDHEVFALNCNADLNGDQVNDCLAGGRAGVFCAVSGKDGKIIWTFGPQKAKNEIMNVYTPQLIRDLDGDGIVDVLAVHGGDPLADPASKFRLSGRLILLSGKDGKVLQWVGTPDQQESYYSPQILVHPDGTEYILFGTGGETHKGSLFVIALHDLYQGKIEKSKAIYKDAYKGVMTPPVLLDLNGDGTEDIVMAMFNSTVVAFDGCSFEQMWNYTIPGSETYSTPSAGFFNSDLTPDFMIKYQVGPGFPLYYYSLSTVLDGTNGKPLLAKPIRDTIGSQASGFSISMEGYGNDIFLYWMADCNGFEGQTQEFSFIKGSNVHEQSRSDLCKQRFQSTLVSRIYALSSSLEPPGIVIYDSETRRSVEYNSSLNTSAEAQEYLKTHPDLWDIFKQYTGKSPFSDPEAEDTGPAQDQFPDDEARVPWLFDTPQQDPGELTEDIRYPPYHNVRKHGRLPLVRPQWTMPSAYEGPLPEEAVAASGGGMDLAIPSPQDGEKMEDGRGYAGDMFRDGMEDREENGRGWYGHSNMEKRHVGPHDQGGIQRLISTGTLAPSLTLSNNSIDLVFATYWFYPSKTQAILPQDRDCIQQHMEQEAERFEKQSKYYGMNHDAYEETITKECLAQSSRDLNPDGIYETQTDYDPFDIHMGQMTVFRLRLKCSCGGESVTSTTQTSDSANCASVLPWDKQHWPAYMGAKGDSYFQN